MSAPSRQMRQHIRPDLAELQNLPPEFDVVDDDDANQTTEDIDDGVPTYAPSAAPSRAAPPPIGAGGTSASKGRERRQKVVRIAGQDVVETDRQRHFNVSLEDDDAEGRDGDGDDDPSPAGPSLAPLVGTIQERKPAEGRAEAKRSHIAGQSRFAARMQLDRDAGLVKTAERRLQQNTMQRPAKLEHTLDGEEWLDEDGHPMSAFRKSRLIKQGLRPPKVRPLAPSKQTHAAAPVASIPNGESSLASILTSVSAENERKVAAMSAEEVEEEVRGLQETFGSQLLEKLKNRKKASENTMPANTLSMAAHMSQQSRRDAPSVEEVREKYFPNEPKVLPSALQWMQDEVPNEVDRESASARFDFEGRLIEQQLGDDDGRTRIAGLHHHGKEQDKPGYTTQELLLLARSTNPSQRVMALQTLARVLLNNPECLDDERLVSRKLMRSNVRGQACVVSSWYVDNRQANVRSAALACIKACLSSTLGGSADAIPLVEFPSFATEDGKALRPAGEKKSDESDLPGVHDRKFRLALAEHLARATRSNDLSVFDTSTLLESLIILSRQSREVCRVIASEQGGLSLVATQFVSQQAWPASGPNTVVTALCLRLIDILVCSSRSVATSLYEGDVALSLLRFLSIPPWTIPDMDVQATAWTHMRLVLQIYTSMGRYGIGSDLYGRSHAIFIAIQDWIRHLDVQRYVQTSTSALLLATLETAMDLFAAWAVCATDAHQTHTHHDITWSQVSEWNELAQCALSSLERSETDALFARLSALRLSTALQEGAKRNGNVTNDEFMTIKSLPDLIRQVEQALSRCVESLRSEDENRSSLKCVPTKELTHLARLSESLLILVKAAHTAETNDQLRSHFDVFRPIVKTILFVLPWQSVQSKEAIRQGVRGLQRRISESIYQVMQSIGSSQWPISFWSQLVLLLPPGSEEVARQVLTIDLLACLDDKSAAMMETVEPFLHELTRSLEQVDAMPLTLSSSTLKTTGTLFLVCDASKQQEEELDPLSGAPLWRSADAGLPLRRDWLLCPLDDLLHSGTCAALNRPDALPSSWDANELEIVVASLTLSVTLFSAQDAEQRPSSAEIYLGIVKVFMLEDEQADNVRVSGRITGRDIFRNATVSSILAQLFALAQQSPHKDDTLELAAQRQFGQSLPFYQLYTSLVGLYDAISFGFELFARALLVPLQMTYAAEYRRLVWADYAHCLPTLTTTVKDAPGTLQAYIDEQEDDDTVIRGMAMALLGGNVHKERNELLYTIATIQLGSFLWSSQAQSPKAKQLMIMLFESTSPGSWQDEVLRWCHPSSGQDKTQRAEASVVQERREMIGKACEVGQRVN